jgi:CspA family cold shock protein
VASGTVKWFNEENGYGYIVPDEGDKDLFVPRGSILGDWRTRPLPEGTRVGRSPRQDDGRRSRIRQDGSWTGAQVRGGGP